MYLPGFDSPEFWGFGGGILVLLVVLAFGAWRAGWLSQRERARIDAATLEAQRQDDVSREQGGASRGGWLQRGLSREGAHKVPEPNTRGI